MVCGKRCLGQLSFTKLVMKVAIVRLSFVNRLSLVSMNFFAVTQTCKPRRKLTVGSENSFPPLLSGMVAWKRVDWPTCDDSHGARTLNVKLPPIHHSTDPTPP